MKIAAIVPAYNEESTIGSVISALKSSPLIDEIIVVSDGSWDRTAEIAHELGVTVVELEQNMGKGGAMYTGTCHTDADVFLFVDADLVGLNRHHVASLLNPIINNRAEMTVGVFEKGRLMTDLAQRITPFLSGQRAMTRKLFEQIPDLKSRGYGVEMALSLYVSKHHCQVEMVHLPNLSQVMKEEKRGFWKGLRQRLRMFWEILRAVKL
ncbi:MAG: glycosyltransferase family 2 protein [Limnochordia bacterium]|nr:glycosyltransferase family 2 protein [Bacillota bacterium]HOB07987.1 glycosyltransferase family 2 protein [Limnochordia bacterium]HPT92153.1 glycosyltransferase family 2 protein [Limnochordia bacterium]HPZ29860.1 glycosyltransferase family 2 protein [Limnochordia bacterium]HQD70619.1 glycosyltransferase family 2 protein [Limnochordia bacterium]